MGCNTLLHHLPTYLQGYAQLAEISEVLQEEVEALWIYKDQVVDNAFVADADEYGVGRYEALMGLTATPSETLEERKFHILVKVNEQLPYTMTGLKEKLETLCGAGGYTVETTEYGLTVGVALTAKQNYDDVDEMLQRVVPANLVVDLSLLYNQNGTLAGFCHSQLGTYTHWELRNEVLINGDEYDEL